MAVHSLRLGVWSIRILRGAAFATGAVGASGAGPVLMLLLTPCGVDIAMVMLLMMMMMMMMTTTMASMTTDSEQYSITKTANTRYVPSDSCLRLLRNCTWQLATWDALPLTDTKIQNLTGTKIKNLKPTF